MNKWRFDNIKMYGTNVKKKVEYEDGNTSIR